MCEVVFRSSLTELHCDDSLQWLARRAARTIDAVVTDPPYGVVEYTPAQLRKQRDDRGVWRLPPSFDGWRRRPVPRFTEMSANDLRELQYFYARLAKRLRPALKPGAHVLVASTPLMSHHVAAAFTGAGLERRGEVVRLTNTFRGGDRPKGAEVEFTDLSVIPRAGWEPWLLFREPLEGTVAENLRRWGTGALRRPSAGRPFVDVIPSSRPTPAERRASQHPSLKPQAFLRRLVHAVLPLGTGVILDPFAGSGSTLAAATALQYRSIGVEIDPAFARSAARAIPQLAGVPAPGREPTSARDQGMVVGV